MVRDKAAPVIGILSVGSARPHAPSLGALAESTAAMSHGLAGEGWWEAWWSSAWRPLAASVPRIGAARTIVR